MGYYQLLLDGLQLPREGIPALGAVCSLLDLSYIRGGEQPVAAPCFKANS